MGINRDKPDLWKSDVLQSVGLLKIHPEVLSMFRKSACPFVASDRLVGLAGVSASLFKNMEDAEKPYVSPRMPAQRLSEELSRIS